MDKSQSSGSETTPEEKARREAEAQPYQLILDGVPQRIFAKDQASAYFYCNKSFAEAFGIEPRAIAGKTDLDFYPEDLAEKHRSDDRKLMLEGMPLTLIERIPGQGHERWVQTLKVPLKDEGGAAIGVLGISWDITEHMRSEEARKRAEEVVARQAREILEISTPVVQTWEGVVMVPLIGSLDSQRTQQLMERLLETIVATRSSVALVDITGVPAIDTQTGRHLIETITATRLLGADVILTGVRPAIAQTLVHLGIDLSGVVTRPSLAAGLRVALDMVSLQVISKT